MDSHRRPRSPPPLEADSTRPAKKQKRVRDIEEDLLRACDADYHIFRNLRFALPYRHDFRTTCKMRWRGRRILDVFEAELSKDSRPGFWASEFAGGRILHNGTPAAADAVWAHNDLVVHAVHRHESPVLAGAEIGIVHEDGDFLAVDKPASMPVHPCGTYRRNSLQYLLAARGWRGLRLLHRLDKATSGVVVFAKRRDAASRFSAALAAHALRKRYLALVTGRFFEGFTIDCSEKLAADKRTLLTAVDAARGKEAQTLFRSVAYSSARDESLVLCEPTTGRSHQIRVHLQHLGHPIIDDVLYNSGHNPEGGARAAANLANAGLRLDAPAEGMDEDGAIAAEGRALGCTTCPTVANPLAAESGRELFISLHALRYEGDEWKYETALPGWACRSRFPGVDVQRRVTSTVWLRDTPVSLAAKALPGPSRAQEAKTAGAVAAREHEPKPEAPGGGARLAQQTVEAAQAASMFSQCAIS